MMKHFLRSMLFSLISSVAYAQTLPSVVPPSPQSMNFQKFGDIPVTFNNGLADVSIPLYTIRSGELEMPMILRYHPSGIKPKVADVSPIGAGWTLDVGGTISRTIRGRADELFQRPSPFLSWLSIDQNNSAGIAYLDNILTNKNKDVEYDKFTYSVVDKYGNFAIDNDGNGNYTAYSYPFVPYKFDIQIAPPTDPKYYKSIAGIDVTDDNGVKYKFGHTNVELASVGNDNAPTTWFLEDMSNHENTNHITIDYGSVPVNFTTTPIVSTSITDQPVKMSPSGGECTIPQITGNGVCSEQGVSINYSTKYIDVIHFKSGYIKFNWDANKVLIQSIVVYDNNNQLSKSFILNRDLFPGSTKFYRLNSLEVKGSDGVTADRYGFTYLILNGNNGQPLADNSCDIDLWGYCRAEGGGPKCPYRTISVTELSSGSPYTHTMQIGNTDLTPNESYARRFTLTKIQYPTGGTSEFIYEGNKYQDYTPGTGVPVILPGAGIRIKQIVSSDNLGTTRTKTYEYEPGFIEFSLFNENNSVKTSFDVHFQCYWQGMQSVPVYYQFRSRIYSQATNADLGDNRVRYKVITEYVGDNTTNQGKTVYTYKYENANAGTNSNNLTTEVTDYRDWANGLLYTKEVYKNSGNNIYVKVRQETSNYEFVIIKQLNNLRASMRSTYNGGGGNNPSSNFINKTDLYNSYGFTNLPPTCYLSDYKVTTGAYYLKSTQVDDYMDNGTTTVVTQFKHDNPANYYETEANSTLSDGSTLVVSKKYPQDMTDAVSLAMVTKNILSPVVEEKKSRLVGGVSTLLSTNQSVFGQFGNVFAPAQVKLSKGSNTPEARLQFNQYDIYGNIREQQKTGDAREVYLWGYNGQYPVARVIGSDYATVSGLVNQTILDNASGTYTDDQIRTELNKIRTGLANVKALVSTYTYSPLAGMTSETDPAGKTTYYVYDTQGRLNLIKDKDGNIIKTFNYHYTGQ
ncbi:MAG: RHS repeat protein [Chitinophagaceae bacterium]|nr:RHS repeat protein [Chitinophagaceae bacterium]